MSEETEDDSSGCEAEGDDVDDECIGQVFGDCFGDIELVDPEEHIRIYSIQRELRLVDEQKANPLNS